MIKYRILLISVIGCIAIVFIIFFLITWFYPLIGLMSIPVIVIIVFIFIRGGEYYETKIRKERFKRRIHKKEK